MISLLFFPIWQKTDKETGEQVVLTAFYASAPHAAAEHQKSTAYIAAVAILCAVTALYSILQFRKRLQQLKLGLLNTLLMSLLIGTFFYGIHQAKEMAFLSFEETYEIGFYLPIIGLLINLMSNRFIKKDEDLVRSADRLR